jgi:GT2 family glycosyltransferase
MINASIVIYNHQPAEIKSLIEALQKSEHVSDIFVMDNSESENPAFQHLGVKYIFNNQNLGYGKANNIAMRESIKDNVRYHLVLNPDIDLEPEILGRIVSFMNNHPEAGLLMPKILYPDGKIQYLCKLIPNPFDLIFRRFLPGKIAEKQQYRFELRAFGYDKIMDVPYLSGAFMFLRVDALKDAGLFDERFFMYPEDIDLSRRIHRKYRTIYYPELAVTHKHEKGSYKNKKLLYIHITNMIKYFNKWGWFFDKERKEINKKILKQFD